MLVSPLRRLYQNPESILRPHVNEGMAVLEVGPAMGYFSLPLARLVGPSGRVVCVDIQERMLQRLRERALKRRLGGPIVTVRATDSSLCLGAYEGRIDFTLAFAVVHEIPDKGRLFDEIRRAMKQESVLLLSEPKGHVSPEAFEETVAIARHAGFGAEKAVAIAGEHSVVMRKMSNE
jgi:ubiquinone/menaquinone biosynthesis C-methylase UbiE